MKLKITFFLSLFFILSFGYVQAQNVVSGIVKDGNGETLPGVSIVEKNTSSNGTQTDANGRFNLTISQSSAVLTVSYIGFLKKEVSVKANETVDIVIEEDQSALEEVIVTGYGTQKRGNLTGSIATVSAAELKDVSSPNVGNMLQGKVAGVDVVASSGKPGALPNIKIRGRSSIRSAVNPLWVVDGVIWHGIPNMNPQDIESISILKDAAAAALYGSRGANGVVVVTLKSASGEDKSVLNVSASSGISVFNTGKFKLEDSQGLYNNWKQFGNPAALPSNFNEDVLKTNTDWLDIGSQNGVTQDYNLSYFGVIGKAKLMTTANYFNEDGTVKGFDYERFTSRMNVEYPITDRITFKPKIAATYTHTKNQQHSLYDMYLGMPWDNPYHADGKPVNPQVSGVDWWGRDESNYLYDLQWNYGNDKIVDLVGNADFQYNINENFTFTSTNNMTYYSSEGFGYVDPRSTSGLADNGRINNSMAKRTTRFTNQMLSYNNQVGKHQIKALAAYEFSDYIYNDLNSTGKGIVPGAEIIGSASEPMKIEGTKNDYAFQSVLFNGNYGYDDRYNLQLSFRRDGASRFGKNNKYGNFFAISGSWNIHNEAFFDIKEFDYLRLKAAYGGVGNTPESLYPQYELYALNAQYNGQPGAVASSLGNDDLTWEKTYATNLGLEFGLFNRIEATVEYYIKNTSGLLHFVPLPSVSGFDGYWDNIGAVRNHGFEFTIGGEVIETPTFTWALDINAGLNRNEITELYEGKRQIMGDRIIEIGQDIDTWYMRKWTGVNPANGDPQWEMINADGSLSNTATYSSATLQRVGTSTPDFFGGMSSSMTYKGFYLNANLAFAQGAKVYNAARELFDSDGAYPTYNQMVLKEDWSRWSPENTNATHPLPIYGGNKNSIKRSSRFIEDASYLRLRNVSLGHKLNDRIAHSLGMKSISLYASADNLLTLTKYSGIDPEAAVDGDTFSPYPIPKRYTFGINFTL